MLSPSSEFVEATRATPTRRLHLVLLTATTISTISTSTATTTNATPTTDYWHHKQAPLAFITASTLVDTSDVRAISAAIDCADAIALVVSMLLQVKTTSPTCCLPRGAPHHDCRRSKTGSCARGIL